MFEVGSIVAGKYRVDRELGRGGMGMVVAATHVHLGTVIALKFLNDKMLEERTVKERFLREARASAQLRNEHICRVLDFGMEGEVPYIVMELLEGTDLAKLVRQHPLPVHVAADYVIQACIGLAEAHAAGVIHRDLKPSNLFLTQRTDGTPLVKVFDFGVAKVIEAVDVNLTQTASVVGSPGYMSPEQVRASKNVDARSDVWALGVILYKLVSTRMPFKAESITDLAVAIAMDPTPPLHDVPIAFEHIVMKCLEKNPAARYQDVNALIAALSPFTQFGARDTRQQTAPIMQMPGPSMMMPTVVADSPTTLRGASGVIERIPPKHNLRPWLIGAGLSVVIGIVVGMTWTSGSTTSQPATQPMVPVVEQPPAPAPVVAPPVVETPAAAAIVVPPKPAPVKPVEKPVEHTKHAVAVPPHAPKVETPAVTPPPQKPKDIGASRI